MRVAPVFILFVVLAGSGSAQQADIETKTYRSDVEMVQVAINVSGKDGAAPKALVQSDFSLTENGVAQVITVFLVEQPSPTTSRFTLGYASKASQTNRKKIEIRIRGFKKPITRTLSPAKLPGTLFHF